MEDRIGCIDSSYSIDELGALIDADSRSRVALRAHLAASARGG